MTVAELIELLSQQPQDAGVEMNSELERQFSEPKTVSLTKGIGGDVVVIWGD